ncbi:murein biosynthesis integral membrane protein MurJ [Yinghuangia soli]|uniref:Peptidoglycan lipid II flippase n=1 Tax=Yinghuangia soli TaxID=2908204 RepID=A0AA41Q5G1_9ACTN|nr:lipid II flippase MurJ [Yinghuangia soli]MCF2531918.1 hypothetical protein [Yinghuangia soli]
MARGLAGAALVIAVLTTLARVAGFGRQLVFNGTVGPTLVGDAYAAANYVPNIVFDVVAGGALASLVVPLLAGPIARGTVEEARRTASALLGWVLLILVPVAVAGMLLARPIMELLLRGQTDTPGMVDLGTGFLVAFMPQIPLYGLAVVSAGILQAHHRFTAAAVAPLVSSLVVAGAYLVFEAGYDGDGSDPQSVPRSSELVLGLGTTAGVLALALCTLVPLRGTGLRLRPALRFPEGVAPRARRLAAAGVATLVAQQLATVTVLMLVSAHAPDGGLVTYQNAWMVYTLPYAILAVPIATSAFPRLTAAAHARDHARFADTAASSTRAVLLVSFAGAAVLAATAYPVAEFFARLGGGKTDPDVLARALVAFAPGLVGYGLMAHLGRALYARGHGRASAGAVVLGWLAVIVTDVLLVPAVPQDWAVGALGLGNTVGMTLAGLLLVAATAKTAGGAALAGVGRIAAGGLFAAAAGRFAGAAVADLVGTGATPRTLISGTAAALVGLAVFAAGAYMTCGDEVRAQVRRDRKGQGETAAGGAEPDSRTDGQTGGKTDGSAADGTADGTVEGEGGRDGTTAR